MTQAPVTAAGRPPHAVDRRYRLPADPAEHPRPAAPRRRGDHHDPRARPGRPALPGQRAPDPGGDPDHGRHRDRAHVPVEQGVRVAGSRDAHRQRRRPILRVVGTPPDDPWNTYAWYVFAGVAAFSLLTKYVIKYRGTHVFNPSNIGLVVAFIVLGSTRIEPLDFWWAPLTNPLMILAYVVIIGGGLLITRRLHLLALAATFWVTLAVGVGLLAALGPLDDRELVVRAGQRLRLLAGHRHLARGHDLPVLHDHRPQDHARRPGRSRGLRLPRRRDEHAADGAPDRRVRHQGRAPRGPRGRVRRSADPRPAACRRRGRPPTRSGCSPDGSRSVATPGWCGASRAWA